MTLTGCKATGPVAAPAASPGGDSGLGASPSAAPKPSAKTSATPTPTTKHTTTPTAHSTPTRSAPSGPRIVSFRIAQKPKCAEGTAVFRAKPVPLIIKWTISGGATGGALSVDDPTHTPGTYVPVALEGSEEFEFSCAGDVGTTEKHTYDLYTVGGGTVRSAHLSASAKILDKGAHSS